MTALLALLTICVAPVSAQDAAGVVLRPELSQGPLTVGDLLEYRVHVPLQGERVFGPREEADFGAWEVRDYREERSADGVTLVYQLAAFETGTQAIPVLDLVVGPDPDHTHAVKVAATEATVESVLQEGDSAPRDIVGPMQVPEEAWAIALRVALGVAIVAAIAGLVWWLWRMRKNRAVEAATRPDPPHVAALKALEALRQRGLPEQGEIKAYYSELTDILRAYVWRRYGVRTLEETTWRIVAGLKRNPHAGPHAERFGDLLREADLVKFAKARPGPDVCESVLESAERLVKDTAPPAPAE